SVSATARKHKALGSRKVAKLQRDKIFCQKTVERRASSMLTSMQSVGGKLMSRQTLVFASCSLGILFLCGFSEFETAGLAQSSLAPATLPVEKDEEARRCLESTCRNAPRREKR